MMKHLRFGTFIFFGVCQICIPNLFSELIVLNRCSLFLVVSLSRSLWALFHWSSIGIYSDLLSIVRSLKPKDWAWKRWTRSLVILPVSRRKILSVNMRFSAASVWQRLKSARVGPSIKKLINKGERFFVNEPGLGLYLNRIFWLTVTIVAGSRCIDVLTGNNDFTPHKSWEVYLGRGLFHTDVMFLHDQNRSLFCLYLASYGSHSSFTFDFQGQDTVYYALSALWTGTDDLVRIHWQARNVDFTSISQADNS